MSDRNAILHARETDGKFLDIEMPTNHAEHFGVRHVGLLDAEVDVLALAGWVVGRNLFDDEIAGAILQAAADAGLGRCARTRARVEALMRRRVGDPVRWHQQSAGRMGQEFC